jgi:hypothetical protein
MLNEIILIGLAALNLGAVACDALTDKSIDRKLGVSWLTWHVYKWIRLYVPQAIILFCLMYWKIVPLTGWVALYAVIYTVLAWMLWNVVYESDYFEGMDVIELQEGQENDE